MVRIITYKNNEIIKMFTSSIEKIEENTGKLEKLFQMKNLRYEKVFIKSNDELLKIKYFI